MGGENQDKRGAGRGEGGAGSAGGDGSHQVCLRFHPPAFGGHPPAPRSPAPYFFSNIEAYSPYPSSASLLAGMKRSEAELMQ